MLYSFVLITSVCQKGGVLTQVRWQLTAYHLMEVLQEDSLGMFDAEGITEG